MDRNQFIERLRNMLVPVEELSYRGKPLWESGLGYRTVSRIPEPHTEPLAKHVDENRAFLTPRSNIQGLMIREGIGFSGDTVERSIDATADTLTLGSIKILQFRATGRVLIKENLQIVADIPANTLVELVSDFPRTLELTGEFGVGGDESHIDYVATYPFLVVAGAGLTIEDWPDSFHYDALEYGQTILRTTNHSAVPAPAGTFQIMGRFSDDPTAVVPLTTPIDITTLTADTAHLVDEWISEDHRQWPADRYIQTDITAGQFEFDYFAHGYRHPQSNDPLTLKNRTIDFVLFAEGNIIS